MVGNFPDLVGAFEKLQLWVAAVSLEVLKLILFCRGKRGFGSKRLILFSDVGGEFGDDNLNDIVASMKEAEIELNVM